MYNFLDVTDLPGADSLPAEAFSFGGSYLDETIPGFRTLYVSGREAMEAEITGMEGETDGSTYIRKRYPARMLTVGYRLSASTPEAFREAYNQLNLVLDPPQQRIVFADEPELFFTGTRSSIGKVPTGRNTVTGEIELLCSDPFKYSEYRLVEETQSAEIYVANEGMPTPCILEITPITGIVELSITGIARNPLNGEDMEIVVSDVQANEPLIIDGENHTVTSAGANKIADTSIWAFPKLTSGINHIILSSEYCDVIVRYKERYL